VSVLEEAHPARSSAVEAATPPLAVDLDGTLVASDLLLESCLLLVKRSPWRLFLLPFWLLRGRAHLKRRLAECVIPNAATLPYRPELVAFLRAEKRRGRTLVLATGADRAVAQAVAQELGLFDEIIASDGIDNLHGAAKRDRLIARFGRGGFDYAGNSASDGAICAAARKSILVAPAAGLRQVASHLDVECEFAAKPPDLAVYLHALRPHHWFKNALAFVPLLAAHRLFDVPLLVHAALACASLCLCASSIYLLNDLLDLPEDRRHPHKKQRMLASGRLPILQAVALIPLLLLGALALGLAQPPLFLAIIGLYCLLMLAYCLRLRDLKGFDTLTLAAGYTLRVAAGSAAVGVPVASWLLVACFLFFFGLALLKRYAELSVMRRLDGADARARAYEVVHSGRIALIGCVSSYLALALFSVQLDALPGFAAGIGLLVAWVFCCLLFAWLSLMWWMAGAGRIHSDPMSFAVNDPASRTIILLMAAALAVAAWP
jgi:4-hydroxybenzoate polyprenyltransferase